MYQAQVEQRLASPDTYGAFSGRGVGGVILGVLSIASIAASAYHGSKRHGGSVGWGVAWGALGGLFPILTPAIGAAQGFGQCHYDCSGTKGPRRRHRALRGGASVWGQ